MKNFSKLLALLLVLIMSVSLVACGGNSVDMNEVTTNKMYCSEKDVQIKDSYTAMYLTLKSGEYSYYIATVSNGQIEVDPEDFGKGSFVIEKNTIIMDGGQTVLTYDPEEKSFSGDGMEFYFLQDLNETD